MFVLSGRGLCDELVTRPEESYRLWCVVVCGLETSRIDAPYIYDISNLRVNSPSFAAINNTGRAMVLYNFTLVFLRVFCGLNTLFKIFHMCCS